MRRAPQNGPHLHAAEHLSGLVLTVVGVFGARTILIWMQTPANVLDLATLYLRIYFWA